MGKIAAKKQARPTAADADEASDAVKQEAERLLEAAGSPELAQNVEPAPNQSLPKPENDAFAKQWGFASYLAMFEASKPVATADKKNWLATNVGSDQWIAWNEQDLHAHGPHSSLDEAARHAGERTKSAAEAPTEPPPTG